MYPKYIRKHGRKFRIQYRYNGELLVKTFDTLEEAQDVLAQLLELYPPRPRGRPVI